MVLVSGFAVYVVCAPPTFRARLLRSIALRGLPARPQGAPSEPRHDCLVRNPAIVRSLRFCFVLRDTPSLA